MDDKSSAKIEHLVLRLGKNSKRYFSKKIVIALLAIFSVLIIVGVVYSFFSKDFISIDTLQRNYESRLLNRSNQDEYNQDENMPFEYGYSWEVFSFLLPDMPNFKEGSVDEGKFVAEINCQESSNYPLTISGITFDNTLPDSKLSHGLQVIQFEFYRFAIEFEDYENDDFLRISYIWSHKNQNYENFRTKEAIFRSGTTIYSLKIIAPISVWNASECRVNEIFDSISVY